MTDELHKDAARVEREARELQQRVRPVVRKMRALTWTISLLSFVLLAAAGAIGFAVASRLLWGAYPGAGRSVIAGILIAALVSGLRRFAKGRLRA